MASSLSRGTVGSVVLVLVCAGVVVACAKGDTADVGPSLAETAQPTEPAPPSQKAPAPPAATEDEDGGASSTRVEPAPAARARARVEPAPAGPSSGGTDAGTDSGSDASVPDAAARRRRRVHEGRAEQRVWARPSVRVRLEPDLRRHERHHRRRELRARRRRPVGLLLHEHDPVREGSHLRIQHVPPVLREPSAPRASELASASARSTTTPAPALR